MEVLKQSISPSRLVLTDTSALFALSHRRDQNHHVAVAIGEQLRDSGYLLVTTNYLVAEFHALLVGRVGSITANRALEQLDNGRTRIFSVEDEDETRARSILRVFPGNGYSLTDATSFALMERMGIRTAFTFDGHFAMHGFEVTELRKQG